MKVEVDLTEYGVKAPKWYDPINPHVINASGGGSEPGPGEDRIAQLVVTETVRRESSFIVNVEV